MENHAEANDVHGINKILIIANWLQRDFDWICVQRFYHDINSSDVGVSLSSFTTFTISARHNGQNWSCEAHVIQKPL